MSSPTSPSRSRSSSPYYGPLNYPRASPPLTHLAYGGPFSELSNAPGSIASHVLNSGRPRRPRGPSALPFYPTTHPVLDVFYQTGKHGPQNGFVVLLAEPGNEPEEVERVVRERYGERGITEETREAVVFLRDGGGVEWVGDERVPGVGVEGEGKEGVADEPVRRWLDRVRESGVLGDEVDVATQGEGEAGDGPIARRIRLTACFPKQWKKGLPLSEAEHTGMATMFVVVCGDKRLLVLVVEGYSPELVEKDVLVRMDLPDEERGVFVAFGRGDEGVQVFS